jgi:EAL domain-containing protein (putative c-di-GMP-specific phosphodiesterase class I)
VFANAMNFCAYFLFAHSLRSLPTGAERGSLPKPILYMLFAVAYFCVLAVFEQQTSHVFQKTAVAIAAAFGSLWVFVASLKAQKIIKNNYLKALGYVFILQAVCWFARAVAINSSGLSSPFDATAINMFIFTSLLILGVMRYMIYIGLRFMLNAFETNDLRKRNRLLENIVLENKLHSALRAKVIVPHYQSIVDLATGKVIGFEALARWHDAELGAVAPDTFIPIIEDSGRIEELTDLMIDQIVIDLPTIKQKFPGALVSINVSSLLFADQYLLKLFGQRLVQYKSEYPSLILEIVEGKIIEANAQVGSQITQLREWGLGISIDDFGKDYSSHSRLIALPFNHLKIDREFIHQLGKSKNADIVVKNIIDLAQSLGISVTAEGVETQQQRNVLVQLGCHCGQGWYFEKDQPLERLHGLPATFGPPVVTELEGA